jgi:hypothetical protein
MRKLFLGTLFVLAGPAAFAQTAVITPDALPASVTTDQSTVLADQTNLTTLLATLKADQTAHKTSAVSVDKSAIKVARATLNADITTLRTDALAYLETANAALKAAAAQLAADETTGDATKIVADRAALKSAIAQAHADRQFILADVFKNSALHGDKIGWLKFENEVKKQTSDEDALADQTNPEPTHKAKHVSASDMAHKSVTGNGKDKSGD